MMDIRKQPPEQKRNPVKAIRQFCLYCMGGSSVEVKDCPSATCALYAFRHGRNPYRTARQMTEEQRAKAIARLQGARAEKRAAT
jgi:hypothetical protein